MGKNALLIILKIKRLIMYATIEIVKQEEK